MNEGLKPFGASVYSTNRGAEELTAQIVDNEARLRSMTAHRDALQKMIEDKPGRLSDLLEIQQALAQAQGDIDSRQSAAGGAETAGLDVGDHVLLPGRNTPRRPSRSGGR